MQNRLLKMPYRSVQRQLQTLQSCGLVKKYAELLIRLVIFGG